MMNKETYELPGLDCGLCGFRTCSEFSVKLFDEPELLKRCIHLSKDRLSVPVNNEQEAKPAFLACGSCSGVCTELNSETTTWRDRLNREFDFYLEHFPEDPGPREIIIPHNPMLTREMDIQPGDVLIGRPLGMSCGCPVTHCGIAMDVDQRTGVLAWCVTGPLQPRQQGYKDLGYYIAEGYEGLVQESRCEIKIGMRYYFQPKMCMLQWRHSGLVNYMNHTPSGWQIRLEGLWIG